MRLFIAEKPSLGKAIAAGLPGIKTNKRTYIETDQGDVVIWVIGHFIEQFEPHEYDEKWKSWNFSTLPIRVVDWKIKPKSLRKNATSDEKKFHASCMVQLDLIGSFLNKADSIVNAGDAEREGQLIIDEVIEYFKQEHKPQKRIWLHALAPADIKIALANLEDNKSKKYSDLLLAAKCRQRADWLVGLNMTRAVTKLLSDEVVTIGRVQTPTLALVVNRCLEIENFTSKSFYELEMDVLSGKDLVKLHFSTTDNDKRILDKAVADKLVKDLMGKTVTLHTESNPKTSNPFPLFDLGGFVKYMEVNYKWDSVKSLEILQQLYDMGYTTYPRVEATKLYPTEEPKGVPTGKSLMATGNFSKADGLPLATRSSVYSLGTEVSHGAIIPTGIIPPSSISSDQAKGWHAIATRFLMSLLPTYRYTETIISTTEYNHLFVAKGEVPITKAQDTWLALGPERKEKVDLPHIKDGSTGVVQSIKAVTKKTTPPNYYTQALLMEDMKSVAKFVTDEKLKKILHDDKSGLGTQATRINIIQGLIKRSYIETSGLKLKDTQFGRSLILTVPKQLKSPGLTAAWEDALNMISLGTYSAEEFMIKIDAFVNHRLAEIKALEGSVKLSSGKLPFAGKTNYPKSTSAGAGAGSGKSTGAAKPRAKTKKSSSAGAGAYTKPSTPPPSKGGYPNKVVNKNSNNEEEEKAVIKRSIGAYDF
jgi:DNA topoisomerase-3